MQDAERPPRWVATPGGYVPDGGETPEPQCSIEITAYGALKEKFVVKRYHGGSSEDCEEAIQLAKMTISDLMANVTSKEVVR